jgi:hypothetical protein
MENLPLNPKQKLMLQNPNIQELMTRLDAVPIPSEEYKTNLRVSDRINQWASTFNSSPAIKRSGGSDDRMDVEGGDRGL